MNAEKDKVIKLLNGRYNYKIKVVIIYGELFGCLYSHFDKKHMAKNEKCIQKGVFYSPSLHFYAFDIKTDLEMNQNEQKSEDEEQKEIDGRLSVKESLQIFEECGFLHAKILKKCNFNYLMKFDVDNMQSTIPKLLGLPPPTEVNTKKKIKNIAEGIVIRPLFLEDHILLKIKSQRFLEITSVKQKRNKVNLDPKSEKIKEDLLNFVDEEFCEFAMRCINDQRLHSVESKIGRLNTENTKDIKRMFVSDVFDELLKEKSEIMNGLQQNQIERVLSFIEMLAQRLLVPSGQVSNEYSIKKTRSESKKDEGKEEKLSKAQKRKRRKNRLMEKYASNWQ